MRDRERLQRLLEEAMGLGRHAQAPEQDMERRYAPGKWTARQIYFHTVDATAMMWWRFCKAVAEPGSPVELMDQDAWAKHLDFPGRSPQKAFTQFGGIIQSVAEAILTLPEERLEGTVIHPERGALTAWQIAEGMARHTLHHMEQIACIREGRPWPPPRE